MLLTHALALPAYQFIGNKKSLRRYGHSVGIDFTKHIFAGTKITYQRTGARLCRRKLNIFGCTDSDGLYLIFCFGGRPNGWTGGRVGSFVRRTFTPHKGNNPNTSFLRVGTHEAAT